MERTVVYCPYTRPSSSGRLCTHSTEDSILLRHTIHTHEVTNQINKKISDSGRLAIYPNDVRKLIRNRSARSPCNNVQKLTVLDHWSVQRLHRNRQGQIDANNFIRQTLCYCGTKQGPVSVVWTCVSVAVSQVSVPSKHVDEWSDATESLSLTSSQVAR